MKDTTLWDDRWIKSGGSLGIAALDRCSGRCFEAIKQWSGADSKHILEAGCGTGRFCIALAGEYRDSRIVAMDLSDFAMKLVKANAGKNGNEPGNIVCVKGDINSMPFRDGSFDMVFNEGVIEHFRDYEAVLFEMFRVVKPGGRVIIAVPNWFNFIYKLTLLFSEKERNKYGYIKLFKHGELKNLFRRVGLKDIKISGYDPAHAVTRLSEYWPKYEWLGRVMDRFLIRPLDLITDNRISGRFGFEIIISGTKKVGSYLEEKISYLWDRRGRSRYHYADFQFAVAERESALYKRFGGLQRKKVLDVGCGLGGKTTYYAKEAGMAFAIDSRLDDLVFAKEFSVSKSAALKFTQANANRLPFKSGSMDVIILNDIVEHLPRPLEAISECGRALKEGGVIFVNFPPFYGPNGGHLGYYLSFPWIHLFPRKFISYLLSRAMPKEGWITPGIVSDVFNSTNRLTIRRFKKLIGRAQLKIRYQHITPYEHRVLKRFVNLPFFDELLSENAHFVIEKI